MSQLETNIIGLYGERGKFWLKNLPELELEAAKVFGLSDLKPIANPTYNYVLSGWQESRPVVLKLGLDVEHETSALKAFEEFGGVRLLAQASGALLLERVMPGQSMKSYFPNDEARGVSAVCEIIKKLHQAPVPKGNSFPRLSDWLKILDKDYVQLEQEYMNKARILRDKLLSISSGDVLLHGDLHHNNILQSSEGWVVIDPKGVIGDAVYDLAVFIRNPIPELLEQSDAIVIIEERIKSFARLLNLDERRIRDWCFVQGVLSIIWAIEDGVDTEYFRRLVSLLSSGIC